MRMRHLLLALLLVPTLLLAETKPIKKPSAHGVQETMDTLVSLVEEKGMTVFARIDHRANAQSIGKTLPDSQVLIFGNPQAGTRIMFNDPAAGLDLPLRMLVHADAQGKTWVVYHNPQEMRKVFALEDCKVLDKIEQALNHLSNAITQ
jgi:uncharacterized protein (DUF302 family)